MGTKKFWKYFKVFSFVNNTMLDSKILVVSGTTIRVIFQNSVTYADLAKGVIG